MLRRLKKLANPKILSLLAGFCLLSCHGSSAQQVTFETYPQQTEVWVGAGASGGFSPLGDSSQPLNLDGRYKASVLLLEFRAEGRKTKSLTLTKGLVKEGTYPEKLYLHPENVLLYPLDFVRLYPAVATGIGVLILVIGIWYFRVSGSQRAAASQGKAFKALGANMRRQFGRYTAYRELGRGGMGVVFLAVPEDSVKEESVVAVKILGKEVSDADAAQSKAPEAPSDEERARFRREIKIIKDLRHPNILNVIDWGLEDDNQYLVMERLKGQELEEYLESSGPLPLEEVVEKFRQLSEGIQYVHNNKVLHRDLKPANIFLTDSGKLKILDFGLARSDHQTQALTNPGAVMGTMDFLAPEAFLGSQATEHFDQFALGVILYQMLSGELPMKAVLKDRRIENFHDLALTKRPSLKTHCPDLDEDIIKVVDKMIDIDPEYRFEDVTKAFRAFEAAATQKKDRTPT